MMRFEESLSILRPIGDPALLAGPLIFSGTILHLVGENERAGSLVNEGLVCAQAAGDEEILRAEEAFRYAVADTGSALEVDWAIEDGYYLYRRKLAFESPTPGITLGEAELPEGRLEDLRLRLREPRTRRGVNPPPRR